MRSDSDPRLLSVVVPSYNHQRYICACLASIDRQTYRNIELVVVDDGSSDDSVRLIQDFASRATIKTRLYTQPNAGAHAAIARGIALSHGQDIAIVNSDDEVSEDRFKTILSLAPRSRAYIAFSEFDFIDELGHVIEREIPNRVWYRNLLREAESVPGLGFSLLLGNFSISTSNFVFSKEMYSLVGGFRAFKTAHDLDFILRCIFYAEPVFVRQKLLRYRLHGSNTINQNRMLERLEVEQIFHDFVEKITHTLPRNSCAPGADALSIYTDHFLRLRPLWFHPDRSGPSFAALKEKAIQAARGNPDAAALKTEIAWMMAEVERNNGTKHDRERSAEEVTAALQAEVSALRNSTSWRMTAPLRSLASFLKK